MSFEGIKFFDLCREATFLEDLAPIKIEKEVHLQRLQFHNRHSEDCPVQERSFSVADCSLIRSTFVVEPNSIFRAVPKIKWQ